MVINNFIAIQFYFITNIRQYYLRVDKGQSHKKKKKNTSKLEI